MDEEQKTILEQLRANFPDEVIKYRKIPGKGNNQLAYIPVNYIIKRLNDVLGLKWNWEIISVETGIDYKRQFLGFDKETRKPMHEQQEIPAIKVVGCLSIVLPDGLIIRRHGIGGASYEQGGAIGDREKIASSNALKRAAWKYGIGTYLAFNDEAQDDTLYLDEPSKSSKGRVKKSSSALDALIN